MAHFFGSVKGNRSEATRLGTKNSGLSTIAASYSGAVKVELWEHENGKTYATVRLTPWEGSGVSHCLFNGPVGQKPEGE